MLELDHVFCFVPDPEQAARRLERDGWVLDAGQAHAGQGTRNRRVVWREQYFELLWMTDVAEARANPLRLDRRAAWATSGASPIGLGFRGRPPQGDRFWLYDALGPRIWIHRDNEELPERPLVFVFEVGDDELEGRRSRMAEASAGGELREVRVRGPSAPSLPPFAGPPIAFEQGAHRLELIVEHAGRRSRLAPWP